MEINYYQIKREITEKRHFQICSNKHETPLVSYQCLYVCSTFECKCSYSFIQFFMKHLYVLMSWPEDVDMLWINFLSFVSVFCSANLSCTMIIHIDKKWLGTLIL